MVSRQQLLSMRMGSSSMGGGASLDNGRANETTITSR